jgi:hypothetical protein
MAGAVLSFRAEVKFRPSAAAWNNLGVAITDPSNVGKDMQQFNEAVTCFENAIELDPDNEDAEASIEELAESEWEFLPKGKRDRPIARLTLDELRISDKYRNNEKPFILVGANPATSEWTTEYLSSLFPDKIVDYYPNNMDKVDNKPYLKPLSEAMDGFKEARYKREGKGGHKRQPPYIQWRMDLESIQMLHSSGGLQWPFIVQPDMAWMHQCMPDPNNMIRFAQWNMMSVGMKGSSMFFHSDGKGMSSMSAQISGRKRWMLCEADQGRSIVRSSYPISLSLIPSLSLPRGFRASGG